MNRLNINLPTPIYLRLESAAKAQQRTKTVLVCNAIDEYLQKHDPEEFESRTRRPVSELPGNSDSESGLRATRTPVSKASKVKSTRPKAVTE